MLRTAAGVATATFYDGIHPTTEKQGATVVGHYTFGGKELLSWDAGTTYEYNMPDTFGSTRQVTDASQAIQAAYTFDGFGNVVSQIGSASNPYRFGHIWGYRTHGDAGLLLVGARYYDPEVGRFITADTWLGDVMDPQSLHRYVYVQGDPINLVDPTGQWWAIAVVLIVIALGVWYLWYTHQNTTVGPPPVGPTARHLPGPPLAP